MSFISLIFDVVPAAISIFFISTFHQALQGIAVKIVTDILLFPFKALRRRRWFKRLSAIFAAFVWLVLAVIIFLGLKSLWTIVLLLI